MRSVWFNPFVLQISVSIIPVMLVFGFFPHLAGEMGLSITTMGYLFFVQRLGGMLAGFFAPALLSRFKPYQIGTVTEVVTALITTGFYFAVTHSVLWAIFVLYGLKAMPGGLLPNVRSYWLKMFPDQAMSRRVLVVVDTIMQTCFALAGLLILAGVTSAQIKGFILFDAATSLIGAAIYYSMRHQELTDEVAPPRFEAPYRYFKLLWLPEFRALTVTQLFLSIAMGGTSVFLVMAGRELFAHAGGYGAAQAVYGIGYFIAGYLVQKSVGEMSAEQLRIVGMRFGMGLLFAICILTLSGAPHLLKFMAFALLYLCYPIFSLYLSTRWYQVVKGTQISQLFAAKGFMVSLVFMFAEPIYAHMSNQTGIYFRVGFFAVTLVAFSYRAVTRSDWRGLNWSSSS